LGFVGGMKENLNFFEVLSGLSPFAFEKRLEQLIPVTV
jgi:hypothetical protein